MSGKIEKRGNRYSFMVDLGRDPVTGKRRRKRHSGYLTLKDAKHARTEILQQLQTGMYVQPSKLTMRDYLVDEWLPRVAARRRPSTVASYRNLVNGALPHIGGIHLQALTAPDLDRLYETLAKEGGRARNKAGKGAGRPLSANTVERTHAVLRKALNDAVKKRLLVANPAVNADPNVRASIPRNDDEVKAWDESQLRLLLDGTREDRQHIIWHVASYTGLRLAEVAGLRWVDIDLARAELRVEQQITSVGYRLEIGPPKTKRARRTIALDGDTVDRLRAHRAEQEGERRRFGDSYADDHGLVFRHEDGRLIHPELIAGWFTRRVKQIEGVPNFTFHSLRHTHATLALKAGAPIHVISQRLGHADVTTTLRYYAWVLPGMDQGAADLVAAFIRGVPDSLGHQNATTSGHSEMAEA